MWCWIGFGAFSLSLSRRFETGSTSIPTGDRVERLNAQHADAESSSNILNSREGERSGNYRSMWNLRSKVRAGVGRRVGQVVVFAGIFVVGSAGVETRNEAYMGP